MHRIILILLLLAGVSPLQRSSQAVQAQQKGDKLTLDFEKYTLDNGLQVVLHQDKSDPIVSVAIQYHVGSNREKTGRTGFAHLFEHMLFQESENVGQDQFFKKIQDAGGTLNGGTWQDGTIYYEVVPKNALEMALWLESDRMGFMINTVTESAFYNQQEVVQNEKRQRVDNNPYGHTSYIIDKSMYPEGHPYNWQVIGELEDLKNATVADVKEFYDRFYGPNNATMVIAGDFDVAETKALVEKYFGEIKRRQEVAPLKIQNVTIGETKRLYHEDNFAKAPQLNMVWAAVEEYNKDAYALNFLAELLSNGKKAPLYKVLVEEKELTSRVMAYNASRQIAGAFRISITANNGISLDSVEQAVLEGFERFEKNGVTDKDMERVKAGLETNFYNRISSILGKSWQLAQYNAFTGDPGFITQDIDNIKAVTRQEVQAVYDKYIKGKPYIITSFVPKDQMALIARSSEKARVVEEEITENEEKEVKEFNAKYEKTPSAIDRSKEPEKGTFPALNIPASWQEQLANGMKVYGIRHAELPLVNFNIRISGGHLLDSFDKIGVANLMTDIMMEGTKNKTPEELEEEIELLGANIGMYTSDQSITIYGNTLSRNFGKTLDLIEEILLEPRWDEAEFNRIKIRTINDIMRREANPNAIASKAFNKLIYGEDHILAYAATGTQESVERITIDDLKQFYAKNYSPSVAAFHIVGSLNKEEILGELKDLETKWKARKVVFPDYTLPEQRDKASLYFVDVPQAKQSVINIGYLALPYTHEDYYPAVVMNNKLGGSFNGNVNLILREEKGYTYGARTYFSGSKIAGPFIASSSVRTNVSFESVSIFRDEITKYREGISQEDLDFTKNSMIKSNARKFETQNSLLGMLAAMSEYDLPADYIKNQEEVVRNMTLERHKQLAQKYLDPAKMIYLVVGDAETQFEQFKEAGFDEVLLIDSDTNPVEIPVGTNTNK
ncbi:MAG: insulinase family protein [Cyclobacteriaceae bacterium]|nr:insulinase family protein [Cyclobacteriaceae bacterium]